MYRFIYNVYARLESRGLRNDYGETSKVAITQRGKVFLDDNFTIKFIDWWDEMPNIFIS